jgi:hypothetical protein
MKAGLLVALLLPAVLFGQQADALPGAVRLEIRSADSLRVLDVRVEVSRGLFGSLGVLRPAAGRVECAGRGCVATTPAELTLTPYDGAGRLASRDTLADLLVTVISLDSPERRVVARGPTVTFDRTGSGDLRIRAARIATQF